MLSPPRPSSSPFRNISTPAPTPRTLLPRTLAPRTRLPPLFPLTHNQLLGGPPPRLVQKHPDGGPPRRARHHTPPAPLRHRPLRRTHHLHRAIHLRRPRDHVL